MIARSYERTWHLYCNGPVLPKKMGKKDSSRILPLLFFTFYAAPERAIRRFSIYFRKCVISRITVFTSTVHTLQFLTDV